MTLPTGPEGDRPLSEFHERGGWYFTRLRDGSVRIRWSGDGTGRDVVHIIPANSWDSIVQHLRATSAPSSQPASEPLTVEHHASQDREKEWYFVVMEPRSKGIYRRGYSCYISKNLDIVDAEFEALRQAEESFAPVHALPDSESITVEEARAVIEGIHYLPDPRYEVWLSGINKLRHIAGMAPRPRPHAVPPHMPGKSNV